MGTVDIYSMYDWFIVIALSSLLSVRIEKERQKTGIYLQLWTAEPHCLKQIWA